MHTIMRRLGLGPAATRGLLRRALSQSEALHHESKDLFDMPSQARAVQYREAHGVTVDGDTGDMDLTPLDAFPAVVKALADVEPRFAQAQEKCFRAMGHGAPTVVQAQTWPVTLGGRDCIGVSKTGSGKTLAFAVPALATIGRHRAEWRAERREGPFALVLAPTRELTQQIAAEMGAIARTHGMSVVSLYGGAGKGPQAAALFRAARKRELFSVVATPGRLRDLLRDGSLALDNVRTLVLDEADRMLDMGFEPQIRDVIRQMPASETGRQTLLFSATWPAEVRGLAQDFTRDPIRVTIGSTDALSCNGDIAQHVQLVRGLRAKVDALLATVAPEGGRPQRQAIVFCNRKATVDDVAQFVGDEGPRVAALHGDLTQARRDQVLKGFKVRQRRHLLPHAPPTYRAYPPCPFPPSPFPRLQSKAIDVLVATDVAARGLDVKELDLVVNFDMTTNLEDYVHRVGRTGRAGRAGEAVTFLEPSDGPVVRGLVNLLRAHGQDVPEDVEQLARARDRAGPARDRRRQFAPRGWGAAAGRGARDGDGWERRGRDFQEWDSPRWRSERRRGGYDEFAPSRDARRGGQDFRFPPPRRAGGRGRYARDDYDDE